MQKRTFVSEDAAMIGIQQLNLRWNGMDVQKRKLSWRQKKSIKWLSKQLGMERWREKILIYVHSVVAGCSSINKGHQNPPKKKKILRVVHDLAVSFCSKLNFVLFSRKPCFFLTI